MFKLVPTPALAIAGVLGVPEQPQNLGAHKKGQKEIENLLQ